MKPRQIQKVEGRNRTTGAIQVETSQTSPLERKPDQVCLGKDLLYQHTVFKIVAGQGNGVLGIHNLNFCRPTINIMNQLATPQ